MFALCTNLVPIFLPGLSGVLRRGLLYSSYETLRMLDGKNYRTVPKPRTSSALVEGGVTPCRINVPWWVERLVANVNTAK